MRLFAAFFSLGVSLAGTFAAAQPVPEAIASDPPADAHDPAGLYAFALPTHGVSINAVLLTAAGAGPHPTVLLLHGFPGNEQNLDLAQAIRRDGWNVLTLHYRGAWGSPGSFTFENVREDAAAALAWLRAPDASVAARIDRDRLVVIGHSMGGWAASFTAARDPHLIGTALISAAPIVAHRGTSRAHLLKALDDNMGTSAGMHTLAATPAGLADEVMRAGDAFDFSRLTGDLASRPLLLVTSDDGLAPASEALARSLRASGDRSPITEVHLATDHSYSDHRIALETTVLRWLDTLPTSR
jgi:uncharacterized protein